MISPFRIALVASFCLLAGCGGLSSVRPYALNDTQVIDYTAPDSRQPYMFYVSLPQNYDKRTSERFPVIVLLDADYTFALTRNVMRLWADRHLSREAIIVGIAYPGAADDMDIYHRTRTHDYTPSFTLKGGYGPEIQKLSGGGPAFLKLLADGILPEIDKRYRTQQGDRMLVGYSFSGLFAAYTLVTHPDLFRRYLIVSPSLWYDNLMIFGAAKTFFATHRELPVKVFWSVGSEENNPQGIRMVDDLKEFAALMNDAHLSGYESELMVFDNDSHHSVFPAALSRGLRALYGFKDY